MPRTLVSATLPDVHCVLALTWLLLLLNFFPAVASDGEACVCACDGDAASCSASVAVGVACGAWLEGFGLGGAVLCCSDVLSSGCAGPAGPLRGGLATDALAADLVMRRVGRGARFCPEESITRTVQ